MREWDYADPSDFLAEVTALNERVHWLESQNEALRQTINRAVTRKVDRSIPTTLLAPPTEPGYYWATNRKTGGREVVEMTGGEIPRLHVVGYEPDVAFSEYDDWSTRLIDPRKA